MESFRIDACLVFSCLLEEWIISCVGLNEKLAVDLTLALLKKKKSEICKLKSLRFEVWIKDKCKEFGFLKTLCSF